MAKEANCLRLQMNSEAREKTTASFLTHCGLSFPLKVCQLMIFGCFFKSLSCTGPVKIYAQIYLQAPTE